MFKLLFALIVSSTVHAGTIKVIGPKNVLGEMSSENYRETMIITKNAVDSQVATGLASYEDRGGWQLVKFSVGLGENGSIGIGPYQFGAILKQRLFYVR